MTTSLVSALAYKTKSVDAAGNTAAIETADIVDQGRAYHSSYFEMLGEQGWPGLSIWLWLQVLGVWQMERLRRRGKDRTGLDQQWQAPLANALQLAQIVYLAGSLFVGIAYQPFVWMLIALQISLSTYVARQRRHESAVPIFARHTPLAGATA